MSRFVVDASVAVKWFLPEDNSKEALQLLREGNELLAPDLIWAEVANVVWKRFRRGELEQAEGAALLRDLRRVPIRTCPSDLLLESAWAIAVNHGRTIYDSLYLALAVNRECPMVTADGLLYRALKQGGWAQHLLWIGDVE